MHGWGMSLEDEEVVVVVGDEAREAVAFGVDEAEHGVVG